MAQELTPAERAQYQQAIRNTLGYTAPFGGGAYGQFVQTLNPNQRAVAEDLERQYFTERTAYQPATQPKIDYSQIEVPKIDYSQISGLMAPTQQAAQGTQAAIGTAALGQAPTLFGGQADLTQGQADLTKGQVGLTTGQTNILSGQQDITGNQQTLAQNQAGLLGSQQGIQTGVTDLQGSVGQAATDTAPATGLYAGQSGLMAAQERLGQDVGRQIGGVQAGVSDFQRAVEAYQRGAQAQRADIQSSGVTGRELLQRQLGDVGVQANRAAEQMAQIRQSAATPVGAAQIASGAVPGGVQQQAAQIAQAAPAPSQAAPIGPLGPVSVDPRDALIQQLLSGYRGLLSPQQ